jgi:hypothetical protein
MCGATDGLKELEKGRMEMSLVNPLTGAARLFKSKYRAHRQLY